MRLIRTLVRTDSKVLLRSRWALAAAVIYPLLIALVAGNALLNASQNVKVAFVNEETASTIEIGDESFDVDSYLDNITGRIKVERYDSRKQALTALDNGSVAGVFVIPRGTFDTAETMLEPAAVSFYIGDNPYGELILERARGATYALNLDLSKALIDANAQYLKTLVTGGRVDVLDGSYFLLGLEPGRELLEDAIDEIEDEDIRDDLREVASFATDAGLAVNFADDALTATATPIVLEDIRTESRNPQLTGQAFSLLIGIVLAIICTAATAQAMAQEFSLGVVQRLPRAFIKPRHMIAGKVIFGVLVGVIFAAGLLVVYMVATQETALRFLAMIAASAVVAGVFSLLGMVLATLVRNPMLAMLATLLVVLPIMPLGLATVDTPLAPLTYLFPFVSSTELLSAALFDINPAEEIRESLTHLAILAALYFAWISRSVKQTIFAG